MPSVKSGVAGLIFDPAKKISLQGLTYGRVWGEGYFPSASTFCSPATRLVRAQKSVTKVNFMAGIISWLCRKKKEFNFPFGTNNYLA